MTHTEKNNKYFDLPITYLEKSQLKTLDQHIINDLELVDTLDPSLNSIYNYYFNSNLNTTTTTSTSTLTSTSTTNVNPLTQNIMQDMVKYYTTDKNYLDDTQRLLKNFKKHSDTTFEYTEILELWNETKNDADFKEKYYYVDFEIIEFLNRSQTFLQFISIYNLLSPIFSLCIPIIIIIVPFFILKLRNIPINVNEYLEILKSVASTNAVGKLFTTNFANITHQEKIYILVSAGFYLFSIYQNFQVCYKFHKNMIRIHKYFDTLKNYIQYTINNMEKFLEQSIAITSYTGFCNDVREKKDILSNILHDLKEISPYYLFSRVKIFEIGYILKQFYIIHTNEDYNRVFMYSFGFNGYIDCLEGLKYNIDNNKINFAEISNDEKCITTFKNSYYASLLHSSPVKNTVKLDKNIIITGPNASGKTTVLKTTLINIIMTQQFGCGFYDASSKIRPFHHIHCYLNIPDTSGRDSLFQAEARRCKDILDSIKSNSPEERHFCAFDELYSGTNPDEAVISSTAFMKYLIKHKNIKCILTTHFIKVCKKLKKLMKNYHMETEKLSDCLKYTYVLKPGISEVKGGLKVLKDMNYPVEIINGTNQ